jgi:hypothetical protein
MVLSESFSVYKRLNETQAVSVLLEKRDKPESLLFESGAVAELGTLWSWKYDCLVAQFLVITRR